METVTVTREIDAPPDAVRAAMADVEAFMRAGGFDGVAVDGDVVTITNRVGLVTIELTLAVVSGADAEDGADVDADDGADADADDGADADYSDADLVYEQRDGIFRDMVTRYTVSPTAAGSEVRATTEFAVKARFVGPLLDATVIKRQRRIELEDQFDYLESVAESGEDA